MDILRNLAVIGCGNMGRSLLRGLQAAKRLPTGKNLRLVDSDRELVERLAAELGGTPVTAPESVKDADLVVLAVKPQVFPQLAAELPDLISSHTLVLSVMAGISRDRLRDLLGIGVRVARCMPNLPMVARHGAIALVTEGLSSAEKTLALSVLEPSGSVVEVAESALDAVTGLSGSGPAFVLEFLMALEDGGVHEGLARPVARELALATLEGTCALLRHGGAEPAFLRDQVTSPGGTTIHGLHSLARDSFRGTVMSAVHAATERSRELGRIKATRLHAPDNG